MDSKKISSANGNIPNEKIGYAQFMQTEHEQLVIKILFTFYHILRKTSHNS